MQIMSIYGADIEGLEALASRFEAHKDTVISLVQQVTGEVDGVVWTGPDAEALRPEWSDRLLRLVGIVDDTFGTIALEAAQQAAEQRHASDG